MKLKAVAKTIHVMKAGERVEVPDEVFESPIQPGSVEYRLDPDTGEQVLTGYSIGSSDLVQNLFSKVGANINS